MAKNETQSCPFYALYQIQDQQESVKKGRMDLTLHVYCRDEVFRIDSFEFIVSAMRDSVSENKRVDS